VSNLVFRSLDRRVIGKNGAKELEVSISGPVPADTLWHEVLTILATAAKFARLVMVKSVSWLSRTSRRR
jgi:hypothetical protein